MSMTENENIEKILYMGVGRSGIDNENSKIAKALNELMQYRVIGTVDECAEMQVQYNYLSTKIKKYEAIGTIEEFKALKEKNTPMDACELKSRIVDMVKAERNNAIDEFVNKAWETLGSEDSDIYARESILEIAEQMKGGEKDG
jgi:hypothetical protein